MARRVVSFTGLNGQGSISISGAKAGDIVVAVIEAAGQNASGAFAPFIATDGALLQASTGDNSGVTFTALLD